MAKNKVVAGDYLNCSVVRTLGLISLNSGFKQILQLDQSTIANYELITEEHRKSAVSGVSRGLVGGVLLGPVGLLAGLSAKNKGTHHVAIEFRDGKKSLVEIDDKIYKILIQKMFNASNASIFDNNPPVDNNTSNSGINNNNYNTQQKKKGCLPIGCLAIIAFAVIFAIVIGNLQNTEKSSVETIIDVTQFSKINSAKLIEIMGEPQRIEDYEWRVPKTNQEIVGKLYVYEDSKYEFILFDDIVMQLDMYSGQSKGDTTDIIGSFENKDDIFKLFGITPSSKMKKEADTNYALRYENVSDTVESVRIFDIENGEFGMAKFTYDSKYFR
ncbi:hypothetical protein R6U77_00665 [Lysinibacillus louembei]|uniref:DUF4178 domain-containing protein n=1 Tax=Lysinibacillus louembei TaxID=1470088 RepID=A0ABZ0RYZ7_9BACI|nr:hypothetical protein [Lysinibacillus louembei]WPK12231.1 hypothetical protein R6U77_00665 [Lysinibacillus louembei]